MRPAQKPQESFRRFAYNNQYLESYEYDQCYGAKRSRLLAEVVERFREILQTRRHVCLRLGKTIHFKSGVAEACGEERDELGFLENPTRLPSTRSSPWRLVPAPLRLAETIVSQGELKASGWRQFLVIEDMQSQHLKYWNEAMNAILDEVFDRSRSSVTEAEARAVNSTTARNYRPGGEKTPFVAEPDRSDFGNTLTHTCGNGRQTEPVGFSTFVNRFDGLGIPSSPLHEF